MTQNTQSQQHPISIYLTIWLLLFVLSAFSYLVDWFQFEGFSRWGLIIIFMLLKAGLICAIFMHLYWERLALLYAILFPCSAILLLLFIMWHESYWTLLVRKIYFMIAGS